MSRARFDVWALVVAFVWLLSAGCAANPPAIESVDWTLEYRTASLDSPLRPYLRVYLRAADADGFADLQELFVIHDRSDLYWEATPSSFLQTGGELEFAVELSAVIGEDFPPGAYRLILVDSSGERDESQMFVSAVDPDRGIVDRVRVGASGVSLSGVGEGTVFIYGPGRSVQTSVPIEAGGAEVLWEDVRRPDSVQWSLWIRDDVAGIDYRLGPLEF